MEPLAERGAGGRSGAAVMKSVAAVALITFAGMTAYEALKQALFPAISLWGSHIVTIVFSTVVAAAASLFVLRRHRRMHRQFIDELGRRIQAERRAREQFSFLQNLIDAIPTPIFYKDTDGVYRGCNKAFSAFTGVPQEEIIGKAAHDVVPKEIADRYVVMDKELFAYPGTQEYELLSLDPGGAARYALFSKATYTDSEGKIAGIVGVIFDITRQKQSERELRDYRAHLEDIVKERTAELILANEQLQASEERYRSLYNHTPVMLHSIDRNGRLVSVSLYWLGKLGYEQGEVIGRRLTDFMTGSSRRYAEETSLPLFMKNGYCRDIPYQFVTKSGEVIDVLLSAVAERDAAGEMVRSLAVLIDVTERRRIEAEKETLEAQLIQSQKMEAVGQLAGGIAHDFNNILTAIISYGGLLEMKMEGGDPLRLYVSQILASAEKAAHLTQGLLAFSRKQIIDPRPVPANSIVRGVERLMSRIIREDIELRTDLAGEDFIVMADSIQIEQVLINLAANARDAMPQGGSLTIKTGRTFIDEHFTAKHGFGRPGPYALISVADTGTGMDEKTRSRIFEPFFTTKEVGKGTGLGLAMVYGIIKQHNGYITVESEPGRGTTFRLLLPISASAIEEMPAAPEAIPKGNKETVLLAEDNPEVRQGTREILEEFGYLVIEAVDGEDALARFDEQQDGIALLILDVIMPKMNGREVYEAIRNKVPAIKALFISGYTDEIIHKRGLLDRELRYIAKPVSPGDLLRKVREVLDKD
ncbi:MAG: PAS domain S-box protein [Nitrospirota bacterium]